MTEDDFDLLEENADKAMDSGDLQEANHLLIKCKNSRIAYIIELLQKAEDERKNVWYLIEAISNLWHMQSKNEISLMYLDQAEKIKSIDFDELISELRPLIDGKHRR